MSGHSVRTRKDALDRGVNEICRNDDDSAVFIGDDGGGSTGSAVCAVVVVVVLLSSVVSISMSVVVVEDDASVSLGLDDGDDADSMSVVAPPPGLWVGPVSDRRVDSMLALTAASPWNEKLRCTYACVHAQQQQTKNE